MSQTPDQRDGAATEPVSPRTKPVLLVSWVLVLAIAAAGFVVLVTTDLPETLITHWGADGPNEWSSRTSQLIVVPLAIVGSAAILLVIGAWSLATGPRAWWAALGLATGVLVGVLVVGLLWSQRRGAGAQADVPVGALLALAVLAAALAGAGLSWWGRPRRSAVSPTPLPLPDDADLLDVPAGARVAWTGTARPGTGTLIGLVLLVLGTAAVLWWLTAPGWALVALLPGLVLLGVLSARVSISTQGVRVRSFGGLVRWFTVPLEEAGHATVTEVRALRDFGGWGIREGRDGRRAFLTRSGTAIEVPRQWAPTLVVTVDDADRAAATLNTLLARERPLGDREPDERRHHEQGGGLH